MVSTSFPGFSHASGNALEKTLGNGLQMVNGSGCAIVLWVYLENLLETKFALCEDKDGHLTETQGWQCLIKIDVSGAQGSDLQKMKKILSHI